MPVRAPERAHLARTERLREPRVLQRLFREGARLERPGFVLLWVAMGGRRAAAFAAGRRLGGSVLRNRIRRRLREAYRRQKAILPGAGVRVCFVARRGAARVPFGALYGEVGDALRSVAHRVAGPGAQP